MTALPQTAETAPTAYLRMHVRANSDAEEDQAVKYAVKDAVVDYLMPIAASCHSKEEAMAALSGALAGIEAEAERVLAEHGFGYGARAALRAEEFPTRVYEGVTLSAGVYDALIVELGEGEGANWWCVAYPPLCFYGDDGNVRYASIIAELIGKLRS